VARVVVADYVPSGAVVGLGPTKRRLAPCPVGARQGLDRQHQANMEADLRPPSHLSGAVVPRGRVQAITGQNNTRALNLIVTVRTRNRERRIGLGETLVLLPFLSYVT